MPYYDDDIVKGGGSQNWKPVQATDYEDFRKSLEVTDTLEVLDRLELFIKQHLPMLTFFERTFSRSFGTHVVLDYELKKEESQPRFLVNLSVTYQVLKDESFFGSPEPNTVTSKLTFGVIESVKQGQYFKFKTDDSPHLVKLNQDGRVDMPFNEFGAFLDQVVKEKIVKFNLYMKAKYNLTVF